MGDVASSLKDPAFWGYSSWLDIMVKYRRTSLGLVWMAVPPFVFIVLLGHVYAGLMGFEPKHYLPYLGTGYLLWRIVMQTISESTSVLRNHKAFIFDGRSRLTDYILRILAKAVFYFVGGLPILVAVVVWSGQLPVANLLSLFLTIPVFAAGMLLLSMHLALFGARYPDTAELTNAALIFAFLVTPILWYPHQAPGGTILGIVTRFNPAFHFIEFVRAPLYGNWPGKTSLLFITSYFVVGTASAAILYRRYGRYVPVWI